MSKRSQKGFWYWVVYTNPGLRYVTRRGWLGKDAQEQGKAAAQDFDNDLEKGAAVIVVIIIIILLYVALRAQQII